MKVFRTQHVTSTLAPCPKLDHHEACAKKNQASCHEHLNPLSAGTSGQIPAKLLILDNLQKAGQGAAPNHVENAPRAASLTFVRRISVGEEVPLPRPRIQLVHGTVPQKCAGWARGQENASDHAPTWITLDL